MNKLVIAAAAAAALGFAGQAQAAKFVFDVHLTSRSGQAVDISFVQTWEPNLDGGSSSYDQVFGPNYEEHYRDIFRDVVGPSTPLDAEIQSVGHPAQPATHNTANVYRLAYGAPAMFSLAEGVEFARRRQEDTFEVVGGGDDATYIERYWGWTQNIYAQRLGSTSLVPGSLTAASGEALVRSFGVFAFDIHGYDNVFTTVCTLDAGCGQRMANVQDVEYQGTATLRAVPEPAAWALTIAGFGLAGARLRRRRAVAA